MPVIRKDEHSGAIIFDLTSDEKGVLQTKEELEVLKQDFEGKISLLDAKLLQIDEAIAQANKGTK